MQAVKALVRLEGCGGPSEPWLVAKLISTRISYAGTYSTCERTDSLITLCRQETPKCVLVLWETLKT